MDKEKVETFVSSLTEACPLLKTLRLANLGSESLPASILYPVLDLTSLTLHDDGLSDIPCVLQSLQSLQKLDVRNNPILFGQNDRRLLDSLPKLKEIVVGVPPPAGNDIIRKSWNSAYHRAVRELKEGGSGATVIVLPLERKDNDYGKDTFEQLTIENELASESYSDS